MTDNLASPSGASKRDNFALVFIISVAAILLTAVDHFHGHVAYLGELNTRNTLIPIETLRTMPSSGPALTRHVTVIFLDGLSYEEAQKLPTLSSWAGQGIQRPMRVEFPSYTYPAVVAYNTGVPPLYSGLRINQPEHTHHLSEHVKLPSLSGEILRAELPLRVSNGDWPTFHALLDPSDQAPEVSLQEVLKDQGQRGLDWIYFGEIDAAGHKQGAASNRYHEAALHGDQLVAQVLSATDLQQDTLIILSDHGHLARGGHGGVEPEVTQAFFMAIGKGIKKAGNLEAVAYLDVASTLSVLLGISTPAANLGRPMLDILALTDDQKAQHLAGSFSQRLQVEEALTPGAMNEESALLLSQLQSGQSLQAGEKFLEQLKQRRIKAFEAERDSRALGRLYWALPIVLVLLGVWVWLHKLGLLRLRVRDAYPLLVYTVIFSILYWIAGYGISWSLPRGEAGFLLETLFFGILGVVTVFWVSYKNDRGKRRLQETAVMVLLFGLPYLLVSVWVGLDPLYLGSATMSYLVIFLATLGFYAHGPFGVSLVIRLFRKN